MANTLGFAAKIYFSKVDKNLKLRIFYRYVMCILTWGQSINYVGSRGGVGVSQIPMLLHKLM